MIFLFGSDFATDLQYPWAREILTGKYHGTQMERAGKLYRQTLDYLEQIAGPGDCHTRNALERISVIARQPLPVSRENFLPDAVRLMQWLYPEKAAHVGKKGLGQVIRKAVGEVSSCGMSTIHNAMIFSTLMFIFGHGCLADPLYPWIENTLQNETITDNAARAERLERKALIWLDNVISSFGLGSTR